MTNLDRRWQNTDPLEAPDQGLFVGQRAGANPGGADRIDPMSNLCMSARCSFEPLKETGGLVTVMPRGLTRRLPLHTVTVLPRPEFSARETGAGQQSSLACPGKQMVRHQLNLRCLAAALLLATSAHPQGIITTIAGTGDTGVLGDGGSATAATMTFPGEIWVDREATVYIATPEGRRIRTVDASGTIHTLTELRSGHLSDIVVADGKVYTAIPAQYSVLMYDPQQRFGIFTIAGNGVSRRSKDGGLATESTLVHPTGVAVDRAGQLYIADRGDNKIRLVDKDGLMRTVAGNGARRFSGDGGPATEAALKDPHYVFVCVEGHVYITDRGNHRIRRVDAETGIITTVAGDGLERFGGNGGPATEASLRSPGDIHVDLAGNLYIADTGNNSIRVVDAETGIIRSVAGSGARGFSGDGRDATSARLNEPKGVFVDTEGKIYISDTFNNRIRLVTPPLRTGPAAIGLDTASLHFEVRISDATAAEVRSPPLTLANRGDQPLTLTLSVDHPAFEVSRGEATVGVDDTILVQVRYAAAGEARRDTAELAILTNDTQRPAIRIGLFGSATLGEEPPPDEPSHAEPEPFSGPTDDLGGWAGIYQGTGTSVFVKITQREGLEPLREVDTLAFEQAVTVAIDTTSSCLATEVHGITDTSCEGCWYVADPSCRPATIRVEFEHLTIRMQSVERLSYTPNGIQVDERLSLNASYWARFLRRDDRITGTIHEDDHRDLWPERTSRTTTVSVAPVGAETAVREAEGIPRPDSELHPGYPNPFNSATRLRFELHREQNVELCIYSPTGQRVVTLVTGGLPAGSHHVVWDGRLADGRNAASGAYLVRLRADSEEMIGKLLLLR